ncbi:MAG: right-handed parallel beta-helix repeat-containing protein [Prolixibacteraceae bacterium]
MNKRSIIGTTVCLILFACIWPDGSASAQKFIHPGIDQTAADMAYMKKQVLAGEQPWKDAFERLKTTTDLQFQVIPFAHVLRGPYGKPNIGGDDLSKGSNMAYNCALMGFLTGDKAYSEKAKEIINAWTPALWDLDYNDAKLLAGWTGHILCNAAEILRYTDSGWQQKDIDRFTQMLMTVYYPLIRFYYPQANGNWDGAIIHTVLAMAIFTDNREMFENALGHFYHSPVNGSIFKYIYPSGQCQESMRDQGHVQLGLGEFAGAAKVAFTQGVDLFSIADNRIGLGYEYTAQFLLGKTPHCYGKISDRAMTLRDDYEYVYRHYAAKGIELPFTKIAADSVRTKAGRSVLTAFRAPAGKAANPMKTPVSSKIAYPAGAMNIAVSPVPYDAIRVKPGESIQTALDEAAGKKGWVIATTGLHKLPGTLKIPSGVTLSGEGLGTILMLDPATGLRDAIMNATDDLHDFTVCDLVLEGAPDPDPGSDPNSRRSYRGSYNRGGFLFYGKQEGAMRNLTFRNLTVRNCTFNGLFITGATQVKILCCDLNENGVNVPSGARQLHNLLLSHCAEVTISDSRLDTSPLGCGIALTNCNKVKVNNCELARNGWYGLLVSESSDVSVSGCLVEANDAEGIMVQYLYAGSKNINISNNLIHYNNGFGVTSYAAKNIKSEGNSYAGNGTDLKSNELISPLKLILMQ